jgi:hypothetical protein
VAVLVAVLGVAAGLVYRACAAEAPLAGTWKVTLLGGPEQETWCLIKVQDRGGKLQAHAIWTTRGFKESTVEDFTADTRAVRFTLKTADNELPVVAYLPRDQHRPTVLVGSLAVGSQLTPVQLEKTNQKELSNKEAKRPNPGFEDLDNLRAVEDARELDAGYLKIGDKYKGQPAALAAAQELVDLRLNSNAPADKLREAADRYIEAAAPYGHEMELQAVAQSASALVVLKKPGALDYARRAEKLVQDTDPPALQVLALRPLAKVLRRAGQADEARPVNARLARVNEALDRDYQARAAVPFKPEPFAGRKGTSGRTVLVELFTGAQCLPCVAADIAFDAARQTYNPGDVALLQYHLHIPGPDPMANPDTRARDTYYGVEGTPTVVIDGKVPDEPISGPAGLGKESYQALRKLVDRELEAGAGASLKVEVHRKGDRLTIEAGVEGLNKPGDNVRLRLALVEDVVRYPGGNGRRFHHHVVRAFPGGTRGLALKEKSSRHTVAVPLGDLGKQLEDYLRKYKPPRSEQHPFAEEDDLPLGLKHLKVVAFIQDDDSKEVLQAVQADVPEAGR